MKIQEMMEKIEFILEDAKAGILATSDKDGRPHMRWMTPAVLKEWPQTIFAVTSPHFHKIIQLSSGNKVEWMLQTRALDQIVNIKGVINVLDNPSLKAQIMEAIGKKLTVFWNINNEKTDFIVLETIIEEAAYFAPMKGIKETLNFKRKGADK